MAHSDDLKAAVERADWDAQDYMNRGFNSRRRMEDRNRLIQAYLALQPRLAKLEAENDRLAEREPLNSETARTVSEENSED